MANAHDEDIRDVDRDATAPVDEPVPDAVAEPVDAVVDAEVVDGDVADEAVVLEGELVDDASSDAESDDVEAEPDARPSVHGRLAKPHKAKPDGPAHAPRKKHRPGFVRRIVLAIILFVLAALLICTGLFCWQKWMRFDDAADIQGVWKVQATGDTIVFDGRDLKLTKGISYEYRINDQDKVITYSFGEYAGGGHYYFSGDRQTLIIIDGDERLDTLAEVGFLPNDLVENDDANDNKTVLAKVSSDTSAEPSGTATGVAAGRTSGEREYVVKPEPSSSSSSSKKKSHSTKSEDDEEDAEHRGFVDEDGDGYDDETDLDYEEFLEYQESLNADENADDEDAELDGDTADEDESDADEWDGENPDDEEA